MMSQEPPPQLFPPPEEPLPAASSKKLGIEVSPKAILAIQKQLRKRGTPEASLRLGLRRGVLGVHLRHRVS
jgi:hypothetical protein